MVTKTSGKLAELQAKRDTALKQAGMASEELAELAEERRDIAPAVYEGDVKAKTTLDDIDAETANLTREAELARAAAHRYAALIDEERQRLDAARKATARAEIEALSHQRYEAGRMAEETMNSLLEQLRRIQDIHQQQARTAAADLADQRMLMNPPDRTLSAWLTNRLQQYLGLPTNAQFRQPLPELDSYSSKADS